MEQKKRIKYLLRTFGCQMNFHDSEKMAGVLNEAGMQETAVHNEADLIIFNTCSIREKAEQKFLSELGRIKSLKRKNPALKIAVAGCIAQQMGRGLFERAPYVDFVLGPQNIHLIKGIVHEEGRGVAVADNPGLSSMELPAARKHWPMAWVSIMYGCNNFCSYCVVPYTRGPEVSRPAEAILSEMRCLSEEGFREVTLLGQNVNSYRGGPGMDFPALLRMIHDIKGIERIRFVTSHPKDLLDGLILAIRELDKLCEHIHLPLQSGSDRVLKAMNRGYGLDDYRRKVESLRKHVPSIAITSDIIAGFPGETDEDHKATISALSEIRFDGIFAFKFSSRAGTAASRLDGHLPEEIKAARLYEILALQDAVTFDINKALEGFCQEVLVEGPSPKEDRDAGGDAFAGITYAGRTRTNKIVNFRCAGNLSVAAGGLLTVRITKARRHSLQGAIP